MAIPSLEMTCPKIGYFGEPEFTLGILSMQLMLSKLFQHKTKMFSMLFLE